MAYSAALSGYFSLLGLLVIWNTLLDPERRTPAVFSLLVFAGPLLIPLRGLLHRKARACVWAAYLSLFYFTHGVIEAYADPAERDLAAIEIVSSLLLFFGASYTVRYSNAN